MATLSSAKPLAKAPSPAPTSLISKPPVAPAPTPATPAAKTPAAPAPSPAPASAKVAAPPAPKTEAPAAKTAKPRGKGKSPASTSKRILFVASECSPLAQSGGLGDAVAGLSKALLHRGNQVQIVMPLFGFIDRFKYNIKFLRSCCTHFGHGEEIWVGIHEGKLDGEVPIWFVE